MQVCLGVHSRPWAAVQLMVDVAFAVSVLCGAWFGMFLSVRLTPTWPPMCSYLTFGVPRFLIVTHHHRHGAWASMVHRAGVATTVERVRAGTGRASLERGNMLVVLPDEGLVVTDVSVVHPTANSFLQRAAPSLPCPWNSRGALVGRQCSFCEH
jgi:hypothetical protein